MALTITPVINNKYNIVTKAPEILGASYNNAKLIGIVDYTVALKTKDIYSLNDLMRVALPNDSEVQTAVPNCTWLMFRNAADTDNIIIAEEWIATMTNVPISNMLTLTIANNTLDPAIIKQALVDIGISNINIKIN